MKKKRLRKLVFIFIVLLSLFSVFAHKMIFNTAIGSVSFPEKYVGANLKMADGQEFTVFRRLRVEGENAGADELAVFIVRFKFKNLKFDTNKRLSIIPAPFLMSMEGFHEKIWTFNHGTGYFQGIYQWESKKTAEAYPDSLVYKLMTKRAAPETVSYEIIPNMDLSKYLQKLVSK